MPTRFLMSHHGEMNPVEVGLDYWLQPIWPEEMSNIAAELLADGYDTPQLRDAAALTASDTREVRDAFVLALKELDAWTPDRTAAQARRLRALARDFAVERRPIDEVASAAKEFVEFDDVAYDTLPTDEHQFATLCWFRGSGDSYDQLGGDAAFVDAASKLAADPKG